MSRTPETDNLARGNHVVPTEFAQDLERQLRKARDTVYRLRKHRAIARNFGKQMEGERDEAWAAFAIATDRCVEAQSNERAAQAKSDRAEKMLRTAAAKADEWRECAERLEQFVAAWSALSTPGSECELALSEFNRLKEGSK
jgi:hypothetical protein